MSGLTRLWNAITHPWTLGASGLLALLGISKGGLVYAAVATFWAQAGSLFGASSITLFVSDQLGLPGWATSAATVVALAAGAAVLTKSALKFWRAVEARTK